MSREEQEAEILLLQMMRRWSRERLYDTRRAPQGAADQLHQEAADLGLHLLTFPETAGGFGLSPAHLPVWVEALSSGDPSLALRVALQAGPVATLWPAEEEGDWAAYLCVDGQTTQPSFSINVGEGGLQLSGKLTRCLCSESDRVLVLLEKEAAYLVSLDDALIEREQESPIGLERAGWVTLKVKQASARRLSVSTTQLQRAWAWDQLVWATLATSIGREASAEGLRYAEERSQFGKALTQFQAIQWMLADSDAELSAAELLIGEAISALSEASESMRGPRLAAEARLLSADAAHQACDRALQIHGGYGYTKDYAVELLWRASLCCEEQLSRERVSRQICEALRGEGGDVEPARGKTEASIPP
ncbi:MAG: acyl-CoA dehydrogenase family protein [Myxococcota bacterium]|nr:acyl-CoA dehydrogenase family protein [Myxococcota bacterium]